MIRNPGALAAILLLNAVPLAGVFAFGWQSYELVLLYWLENLVIGLFTVLRFVVRPYRHPIDLVAPLFLAPFFTVHYGMFCWGHGFFVVSFLGDDVDPSRGLAQAVLPIFESPVMIWAVGALFLLRLLDWARDIRAHGLGGEGAIPLMLAPYRRIVVLHLTIIIAAGALGALDQPTVGLVVLVLLKTGFDIHALGREGKEDEGADAAARDPASLLDAADIAKLTEQFPRPVVKVNDQEVEYESFAAMRDSKHYRMMTGLLRMVGKSRDLAKIEAYMELRVREERGEGAPAPAASATPDRRTAALHDSRPSR